MINSESKVAIIAAKYIESREVIPKSFIKSLVESEDIEMQGIAYRIFDQFSFLIGYDFTKSEYVNFMILFLRRCLLENPDGDFSESRYIAAHSITSIYRALKKEGPKNSTELTKLRNMLKEVYCDGCEDVQMAVINGVLEHLFLEIPIRIEFEDWKHDRCLRSAYLQALEYSAK